MDRIRSIKARDIIDSRGNPTIEVELSTERAEVVSSVPSGASVGTYEALELRDNEDRFFGKGVLKAIANVNEIISPALIGQRVVNQREVDDLLIRLDGTDNFSKLGANATLAVSMAVCRAAAKSIEIPLYGYISGLSAQEISIPRPFFNLINGGAHAGNDLSFQEFMISPDRESFKEQLRQASEEYHLLKKKIEAKYSLSATNIGDEGGFAPPIKDPVDALNILPEKVSIGLDVAAGEFLREGKYETGFASLSGKDLLDYYINILDRYPIVSIEDPFAEDDWDLWKELTDKVSDKILIIGDDLLATNPKRIKLAAERRACNGMILKLNQIGTVSLGIESAKIAQRFNWKVMVSHRSGETTDDFIADFSVGIGSDFIKAGAPARGERVSKYNRLLKIEEELRVQEE